MFLVFMNKCFLGGLKQLGGSLAPSLFSLSTLANAALVLPLPAQLGCLVPGVLSGGTADTELLELRGVANLGCLSWVLQVLCGCRLYTH